MVSETKKPRLTHFLVQPKILTKTRFFLEKSIQFFPDLQWTEALTWSDVVSQSPDLIVVESALDDDKAFLQYLHGFRKKIRDLGQIGTPAIFIHDLSSSLFPTVFKEMLYDNWYFDILSDRQLETLPMRMANLFRIKDHLHELQRYEKALQKLQDDLDSLTAHLKLS